MSADHKYHLDGCLYPSTGLCRCAQIAAARRPIGLPPVGVPPYASRYGDVYFWEDEVGRIWRWYNGTIQSSTSEEWREERMGKSAFDRLAQINYCEPQPTHGALARPPDQPVRGPGIKLDEGKPKVMAHFLMEFPNAIRQVATHAERTVNDPGHVRYGWKAVQDGFRRYSEALARHILETPESALVVDDSTIHPAAMAQLVESATVVAWNAMARLELLLKSQSSDGVAAESSHEARRVV